MKTMYYITTCMCKLPAEKLKVKNDKRVCGIHGGEITHRVRECMDCKKELMLCETGTGKLRCSKHETSHNKKVQKLANIKTYAKTKKKNKIKKEARTKKKNAIKKAARALELKRNKEQVISKPVNIQKPAEKKQIIPKRMIGWSLDKFGDYCRNLPGCVVLHKPLLCSVCGEYVGIFKGHDPRKMEQFAI